MPERFDFIRQSLTLQIQVGGHFSADLHASRVCPGFDPDIKPKILSHLVSLLFLYWDVHEFRLTSCTRRQGVPVRVLFCVNVEDVVKGRKWGTDESYSEMVFRTLDEFAKVRAPHRMLQD